MPRVVRVALVHLSAVGSVLVTPVALIGILTASAVGLAYFARGIEAEPGPLTALLPLLTSGPLIIIIYSVTVGAQAITRTFPFALGIGVTRREYVQGTVLAFSCLAIAYSTVIAAGSAIEVATDGWGITLTVLSSAVLGGGENQWPVLVTLLLSGATVAAISLKWRSLGLFAFSAVAAAISLVGFLLARQLPPGALTVLSSIPPIAVLATVAILGGTVLAGIMRSVLLRLSPRD